MRSEYIHVCAQVRSFHLKLNSAGCNCPVNHREGSSSLQAEPLGDTLICLEEGEYSRTCM